MDQNMDQNLDKNLTSSKISYLRIRTKTPGMQYLYVKRKKERNFSFTATLLTVPSTYLSSYNESINSDHYPRWGVHVYG